MNQTGHRFREEFQKAMRATMQAEAKGSITLQQAHSIQRELTAVLVTTQINAMLEQAIPEAFRHNR